LHLVGFLLIYNTDIFPEQNKSETQRRRRRRRRRKKKKK